MFDPLLTWKEQFIELDFTILNCNLGDARIDVGELGKLITGVVEIHNSLVSYAFGPEHAPSIELIHVQMNSPVTGVIGIAKDIADAFIALIKIPFEIRKAKKELEEKDAEIEKKREEAYIVRHHGQHQVAVQSLELDRLELDLNKKRVELAAFAHEKIKEILANQLAVGQDLHAARILAPYTEQCIQGIADLASCKLHISVADIKPIYKDMESPNYKEMEASPAGLDSVDED